MKVELFLWCCILVFFMQWYMIVVDSVHLLFVLGFLSNNLYVNKPQRLKDSKFPNDSITNKFIMQNTLIVFGTNTTQLEYLKDFLFIIIN